jgi:magnesium-transporting ATPase (P-type)
MVKIGSSRQTRKFCSNNIKTSKYELWNFFPKFFLEEFNPNTKIANCYFLLISGMQILPPITNTDGYPTVLLPLSMVLIISGVFKALEDISRHKADTKANSTVTEVFDAVSGEFKTVKWADLKVGDVVRVLNRQTIPADLVTLLVAEVDKTTAAKGVCYVETKSLDGETNLKVRNVVSSLLGSLTDSTGLQSLSGHIEMEHPNPLIDSFSGVLYTSQKSDPATVLRKEAADRSIVGSNNMLLRGCVLRSTDWAVGLVVNTGNDMKIMQSNIKPRNKYSHLEMMAANNAVGVISLLLFVCLFGASAQSVLNAELHVTSWYYLDWQINPASQWFIKFFYMLLLHASFIPVSLYVSMALARFFQSYFMMMDLDMYYSPSDSPAVVRQMLLNEHLGQITHIFTDKTGTLTCNDMNFRKASINGVSYGEGLTEIGRVAWKLMGKTIPPEMELSEKLAQENRVAHVSFYDPKFYSDLGSTQKQQPSSPAKPMDFMASLSIRTIDNDDDEGSDGDQTLPSSPTSPTSLTIQASESNYTLLDGVSPKATEKEKRLRDRMGTQQQLIKTFYKYISVCHEVIAQKLDEGGCKWSAPSPDDEALVCAAAYFGYEFEDRIGNVIVVHERETQIKLKIAVLYTVAFTSKRKRMSVVIRDTDGRIKVITKGADSVMFERGVDPTSAVFMQTKADIDTFSVEGLRCLVVAVKVLPEEAFAVWAAQYDAAWADLRELEARKLEHDNRIDRLEDELEMGFEIIGATAIEDRLQDGVPTAIEKLCQAGMKVLMLTGDKEETAINIAVACNLVLPSDYMDQIILNSTKAPTLSAAVAILTDAITMQHSGTPQDGSPDAVLSSNEQTPPRTPRSFLYSNVEENGRGSIPDNFEETRGPTQTTGTPTGSSTTSPLDHRSKCQWANTSFMSTASTERKPLALIIDGPTLIFMMADDKCRSLLIQLIEMCKAVVFCRVSPDQKRMMVSFVQKESIGVRSLAVGDGANDVAMITAADVGVGIQGEEGVQAVNASDYAIAQFRFLVPLLLKHGRYNYLRMSTLVMFMFYKNILLSMTMFWASLRDGFSEQKIYTESGIQFYNLFYTSLPIIVTAVYDTDIPFQKVLDYPQLYFAGLHDLRFNYRVFCWWVADAVVESAFILFMSYSLLSNYDPDTGVLGSWCAAGGLSITAVIVVANFKTFTYQHDYYWFTYAVLAFSIISWFFFGFITNKILAVDYDFYGVFSSLLGSRVFWLSLLVVVVAVMVKDIAIGAIQRNWSPTARHILQEMNEKSCFGVNTATTNRGVTELEMTTSTAPSSPMGSRPTTVPANSVV